MQSFKVLVDSESQVVFAGPDLPGIWKNLAQVLVRSQGKRSALVWGSTVQAAGYVEAQAAALAIPAGARGSIRKVGRSGKDIA